MKEVSEEDRLARQRAASAKWYARHKARRNAQRRQKYQDDPAYREHVKQAAKQPRGEIDEENCTRTTMHKGREVEVYTISYVALHAGVSDSALRKWEREGWIPHTTFDSKHRLYTVNQMVLIKGFASSLRDDPSSKDEASKFVYNRWMEGL